MSLRLEYHELTQADLYAAWSWYEEREPGLGDRFVASVDASLERIVAWPGSGSPAVEVDGRILERRIATAGFPYIIRYRILGESVLVTAIYHRRRRPGYGTDRTP